MGSAIGALVLGAGLFLPGLVAAQVTCVDQTSGPFGSLLDVSEFNAAVQALPPAALSADGVQPVLPPKAFLGNLPAVSQQGTTATPGSPGTCEAQSFGYGLGSYTAARHPDGSSKWKAALAQNSISPAYLFALGITDGFATCPKGGAALPYLAQLVAFGAPTRARVGYQPSCDYLADVVPAQRDFPQSYPDMKRFRIGSYAAFQVFENPAAAVQLIKQFIANGQAVAFSGKVLCGYGTDLPMRDGVIYETSYAVNGEGQPLGHGQLIVGYDDTVGTPGKKGALLVQNSFGTAWPASAGAVSPAPAGMAYWSYDSFEKTQMLAAVAYPRSSGPPSGVRLAGDAHAPLASIPGALQWSSDTEPQSVYLILKHFFHDPVMITKISLTEPGGNAVTATGAYGQYVNAGYSYLKRSDGRAFLSGRWEVTLEGADTRGKPVSYSGALLVGTPQPISLPGASMAGRQITDSTGAPAILSR
jgi:hypothetical protein